MNGRLDRPASTAALDDQKEEIFDDYDRDHHAIA